MSVTISWKVDGRSAGTIDKVVGQVPIMVKVGFHPHEVEHGHMKNSSWRVKEYMALERVL